MVAERCPGWLVAGLTNDDFCVSPRQIDSCRYLIDIKFFIKNLFHRKSVQIDEECFVVGCESYSTNVNRIW